jgi:hypothetical protein
MTPFLPNLRGYSVVTAGLVLSLRRFGTMAVLKHSIGARVVT